MSPVKAKPESSHQVRHKILHAFRMNRQLNYSIPSACPHSSQVQREVDVMCGIMTKAEISFCCILKSCRHRHHRLSPTSRITEVESKQQRYFSNSKLRQRGRSVSETGLTSINLYQVCACLGLGQDDTHHVFLQDRVFLCSACKLGYLVTLTLQFSLAHNFISIVELCKKMFRVSKPCNFTFLTKSSQNLALNTQLCSRSFHSKKLWTNID